MTKLIIEKLEINLNGKLPGMKAQENMAPNIRFPKSKFPDPELSQPSGVLILLYPNKGEWATVFIKRTSFGPHGGQISLPGGKQEKEDSDIIATALREAEEEIGADRNKIKVIGRLSPLFVPHSNFCISPVVGYQEDFPIFVKNQKEVQSIIRIQLNELFSQSNRGVQIFNRPDYEIQAPYYNAHGHLIWGATAMIMSEFEELIQ